MLLSKKKSRFPKIENGHNNKFKKGFIEIGLAKRGRILNRPLIRMGKTYVQSFLSSVDERTLMILFVFSDYES